MKVGDLVKHPKGTENVCSDTYSLGVVLSIIYSDTWGPQAMVQWLFGRQTKHKYMCSNLEVIYEGR